jgi:hypothetical protein
MAETPAQLMHCMEVWGGNEVADQGVVIAGLDAWVYCRPYKDAIGGGDVYYVSACATGRITRLLIADVSGHGSAVSEIAARLRTLMRRYVNFLDQTQFVHSLNAQFTALSEDCCFATAVVTGPRKSGGHSSTAGQTMPTSPGAFRRFARTISSTWRWNWVI